MVRASKKEGNNEGRRARAYIDSTIGRREGRRGRDAAADSNQQECNSLAQLCKLAASRALLRCSLFVLVVLIRAPVPGKVTRLNWVLLSSMFQAPGNAHTCSYSMMLTHPFITRRASASWECRSSSSQPAPMPKLSARSHQS
jgi:hypothetical protein